MTVRLRRHGLRAGAGRQGRRRARSAGACRSCPTTARSRSRTCAPTTTRTAGWSPSIPSRARRRVARRAARRCVGAGGRRLRPERSVVRLAAGSEARLVPLGARRLDAPLHASTPAPTQPAARQLTAGQVGDRRRSSCRPTSKKFYITSTEVASGRAAHLRDAGRRRRAHEADVDDRRERRRSVARRQHVRARSIRTAPSRTRCT